MSTEKTLIGALAGLTAGIALGVLLAPDKGSETRRKLKDSAEEVKHKVQHLIGKEAKDLDELERIFRGEVDGIQEDIRKRVLRLIEASKSMVQDLNWGKAGSSEA